MFTRPLILTLAFASPLHSQEPVIGMATEARFWLRTAEGHSAPTGCSVTTGTASQDDRQTQVTFPVRWWKWQEVTLRFTPASTGQIELALNGIWSRNDDGAMERLEILWDDLRATGTDLKNDGFEEVSNGIPVGWTVPEGSYPAENAWPLEGASAHEGKRVAASWQKRPLSRRLEVKEGSEVTLTLRARAATPPGFVVPKKLGADTPAHRALAKIKRGVNLGNCWEAPPPYSWGIRYTPEDIDRIAAEGFDHIRVPVAWHFYLKESPEGFEISSSLLADLEPVLRRALEKNMHVLVNWHHFHDLTSEPEVHREKFTAVWEALARHFKDWPPELFIELLNEPRDELTTERVNGIHTETIAAIRKIDPERIVFLDPGNWANIREIDKMLLPDNDDRLVVSVHSYEPYYFTHQRADWTGLRALRNISYPGPPASPVELPESLKENRGVASFLRDYNMLPADRNPCGPHVIRELLDHAAGWSKEFGRPVHLGEFGAINSADMASRTRYSRDVRNFAEERGMPWALWDWKARFGYWDARENQPLLRDALFK